jgi:hypothetical protein
VVVVVSVRLLLTPPQAHTPMKAVVVAEEGIEVGVGVIEDQNLV